MTDAIEHFNRGVDAYKSGDLDTAIQELETATQLDHLNYKAFSYLGAAYAAKQRFNAAIGSFKTAEQISPEIPSIHFNIAQAYEAADMLNDAEYEYDRALQLDPNYTKAKDSLDRVKKKLDHI